MRYWMFKSESDNWSWNHQAARGAQGEESDGVLNYQAGNFTRNLALSDRFFYHSQKQKAIVGGIEIIALAHLDSNGDDLCWECGGIKALSVFDPLVILAQIKHDPQLSEMMLVKTSLLSVQLVSAAHGRIIGSLTLNSSS